MLKSGDFTDPVTRTTFSDDDLKEIDALAIKSKLNKGSVYKAKHEPNRYADAIFIRDALLGLERWYIYSIIISLFLSFFIYY